jgi:large subunit ribosomal protein L9
MQKQTQDAELLKAQIEKISYIFALRAGEEGKLFGSVTSLDIAAKLTEQGIEIDRKKIVLDDHIKTLGEHAVSIKLSAGVVATIKVVVNAAA